MFIQSPSGPVLYLLLTVGVVFALAGLRLIFTKSAEENAARIELFGLKFQSSSAGLLVLLIGAGFLSVPLFNPQMDLQATPESPSLPMQEEPTPAPADSPELPDQGSAILLPQAANAPEVEPNSKITEANQFFLGSGAAGNIDRSRDDFEDWYVVDIGESGSSDYVAQIRSAGGCRLAVFDAREQRIDDVYCSRGGSALIEFFAPDQDRVYMRVFFNGGSSEAKSSYEVFLRQQ